MQRDMFPSLVCEDISIDLSEVSEIRNTNIQKIYKPGNTSLS